MLRRDTAIFLHCPTDSPRRTLRPGIVIDVGPETFHVELTDGYPPPNPGEPGLIYYDLRSDFVLQPMFTRAVLRNSPTPVIAIELTGEPRDAESRQSFRVSTIFVNDLTARVGLFPACPVHDVSATGFSAIAPPGFDKGRILPVSMHYRGETHEGNVAVQSINRLSDDQARYGLHCVDDFGPLPNCLCRIAMDVQRKHLRNRRGR